MPFGSQFTRLRVGNAGTSYDTTLRSIPATPSQYGPEMGVPTSPVYVYDVVPATLQAANLAASQTVSGAPASFTLAAGTSVTATTLQTSTGTQTVYAVDVPRCLTATAVDSTVTTVTLTYYGYDEYSQPMSQTITGPSGTSTTTVTTTKAFKYVSAVTASGNSTTGISLGTSDTLGLPLRTDAFEYLRLAYNSAVVTASTGFTAAVTSTASATTGDVRGTYALQTAANGSRRLTAWIYVANPDTVTGAYGVVQA